MEGLQLRSLVKESGKLELSLARVNVAEPKDDEITVRVEGTPLAAKEGLDPLEFVRTIAVARITMPESMVRLSAGREDMTDETQALCLLAGANSIFYGPKLLTTPNPAQDRDMALLDRLGMSAMPV